MFKPLLIGWLQAKGVALASEASDQEVLAAVQRVATAQEKPALENSSRIVALENELGPLRQRVAAAETALANEQTARRAERKGRAAAIVDNVILAGRLAVADRDVQIDALENSKDEAAFAAAGEALNKRQRIQGVRLNAESGRVLANENDAVADGTAEYWEEFIRQLPHCNQDSIKAHTAVMKKPGLADKLRPKK